MKVNFEKIIPEVWWDVFGRLIPGLIVVGVLKKAGFLASFPQLTEKAVLLFASGYALGHLLQPLASRAEGRVSGLIMKERESRRPDPSENFFKRSYYTLLAHPAFVNEIVISAKKKHSEAVSFYSVLIPTFLVSIHLVKWHWIFALSLFFFVGFFGRCLNSDFKFQSLTNFACISILLYLIGKYLFGAIDFNKDWSMALTALVLYGAVERTVNKIIREELVVTNFADNPEGYAAALKKSESRDDE